MSPECNENGNEKFKRVASRHRRNPALCLGLSIARRVRKRQRKSLNHAYVSNVTRLDGTSQFAGLARIVRLSLPCETGSYIGWRGLRAANFGRVPTRRIAPWR